MDSLKETFTKLNLIVDGKPWIRFSDSAFLKLCLPLWDTDTDGGITMEEGDISCMLYGSPFKGNTDIVDATEFKFLNWTYPPAYMTDLFNGCINLQRVSLRDNTYITGQMFLDCTSLISVELPTTVQDPDSTKGSVFMNCTSLKSVVLPLNKRVYGNNFFRNSGIESLEFPDAVTTIGEWTCFSNAALREVHIGANITEIGQQNFNNCKNITWFSIAATTPPILAHKNSFDNTTFPIYVPLGCGDAYKSATNWSAWASRIQEYDFNNE